MNTFEYHYPVEMKELIFSEYSKNKFIGREMVYVLGENHKYNIVWSRDFNTWWTMIKNNL